MYVFSTSSTVTVDSCICVKTVKVKTFNIDDYAKPFLAFPFPTVCICYKKG